MSNSVPLDHRSEMFVRYALRPVQTPSFCTIPSRFASAEHADACTLRGISGSSSTSVASTVYTSIVLGVRLTHAQYSTTATASRTNATPPTEARIITRG